MREGTRCKQAESLLGETAKGSLFHSSEEKDGETPPESDSTGICSGGGIGAAILFRMERAYAMGLGRRVAA